MKAVLLVLVLGTIAPLHVRLGPVQVPALCLLAGAEAVLAAAGTWLAVRVLRPWFRSWLRAAGGAW